MARDGNDKKAPRKVNHSRRFLSAFAIQPRALPVGSHEGVAMSIKSRMKYSKRHKTILISTMFLGFLSASAFCQTSSDPISFTQKEIAFFKWGNGGNEVVLIKDESENSYHGPDLGGKKYTYRWPSKIEMDGNDNVYFYAGAGRIFMIPFDGSSIKTISAQKTGGLGCVDETGNIYGGYVKKGESAGFTLTRPDGTQKTYKNFYLGYEENGIVYDTVHNKSLTITGNGNNPEKFPPHLFSGKDGKDYEIKFPNSFFAIFTEKINKHLKKINRRIDSGKIQIKLEKKEGFWPLADLIGVDDNCNSYILCCYAGENYDAPYKKAYVMVYSKTGQKISEIPIELDYFNKHVSGIKLDIQGNVFQMHASEDGLHIIEWVKN